MKHSIRTSAVVCAAFLLSLAGAACLAPPLRPVGPGATTPEDSKLNFRRYPLLTEDGRNLYAWYLPAPKPRAVLVQFHDDGVGMSEAYTSLDWLVGRGFGLLTFDYRGYGRSEGRASIQNFHRDAATVLKFAHDFAAKNNTKLIVYGQGMGALVALRAVPFMKSQKHLNAVVVEGYQPSYAAHARSAYRDRYGCVFPLNLIPAAFTQSGPPLPAGGAGPGVLKKVPLFVLHGTRDRVASMAGARRLYNSARKPRFFLELPAGHDVWRAESSAGSRDLFVKLLETAATDGDFTDFEDKFEPGDAEY